MDNGRAFYSEQIKHLLLKWNVKGLYRAAYRPSGNGIEERNHRTVKAIAERANISPPEAVYWYNSSPRNGIDPNSVPQKAVYCYDWQKGMDMIEEIEESSKSGGRFEIGDEVWVKPQNTRCVTKWRRGMVTGINSLNNVEVDGVPRHVLDLRKVVGDLSQTGIAGESDGDEHETRTTIEFQSEPGDDDGESEQVDDVENAGHQERERRPPRWLDQFDTGN